MEETDFKSLGSRLKAKDAAHAAWKKKLQVLRRPVRKESIFTEEQRAWLGEVSNKWIAKKVHAGHKKASADRFHKFTTRQTVRGYKSKKSKMAGKIGQFLLGR
jgi:hypothetical protein